jgi:hypothetical protein
MLDAITRTSTSAPLRAGIGHSAGSMTSGPPTPVATIARIVTMAHSSRCGTSSEHDPEVAHVNGVSRWQKVKP